MESRRNLRVLPSNAPSAPENENIHRPPSENLGLHASLQICPNFNNGIDCMVCGLLHACSTCLQEGHDARRCKKGILRVSSGNVGSSEPATHSNNCKSEPDVHYPFGVSRPLSKAPDYSTRNARKLEHRRRQRISDPLSKLPLTYRSELLSPRYNAYRAKARSKGPNQPWPDDLEEAFQEALRLYPRRGRKKELLNGKQSGGNEFITEHIRRVTGITRTRKQVSSHIQVLKNFLSDNIPWMSLVIANGFNPNKEDDRKRRGSLKREEATSCWTNISGPSHYTQVAPTRSISPLSPLPVEMLGSNEYQYPTIRRVEFAMELFKAGTEDVIHTYTTIQYVMASPSRPLEGLRNWRTLYPPLAVYYDQGQIDCPTFLFDTKLSLMEDVPGCNAVLSIQNFLDMTQGVKYTNWQSHTRFYEEEGRPVDLATFYKGSEFGNALVQLSVHPGARPTDCKLEGLPLKSAWWASTFSKMITQSLKAKATEDPNAMKTEEENIERYIRGISVMQEIYASSHAHGSKPKRMAILVWKFSKSRKGEAATTSWHRLVPPESAFQVQSPMPPQLQPHLTLDTTIENAVVQHPTAPYTDFYNPQPSLFADNAEELLDASLSDGSSPETPPPSDYASFPSSTSTSFPSNISNQAYPSHLAQGSSFQSQDSAYSSLASFASQDSHYHSQEMYDSQESLYHSQDALYHHQTSTQVYDWPTPHPLLTDDTAATQDFTGGKIHIAYPPDEESNFHHTYEPQLFAPRAGMTSQHQLIQHPEQFDHHDYLEPELASQGGDTTQCIDWQLIASQGVQVGDMRFQEGELGEDGVVQWEQGLEQIVGGDGVEGQGQILGEVLEGGGEGEGGVEGELGAFH